MPSDAHFDSEEAVDELLAARVPPQHAKAHAMLLANALHEHDKAISARCCTRQDLASAVAPLATKAELADTEARLVARMDASEMKLGAELKVSTLSLKSELMKWWITISLGQAALIAAIVRLID